MGTGFVGFSSVVAWARYVVTPIVILWIAYMMIKAFGTEPSAVLGAHPKTIAPMTTMQGIMAILGVCVWGDEPDFWRYGKPSFWWAGWGYAVGLILGDLLFTLAGWVMAELAITRGGDGSFANAVSFTTSYSLFGLIWLAFIVSVVSQMAAQDGNYYAAVNALQALFGEIRHWSRLYSCAIAVAVGVAATWFVIHGGNTWLDVVNFGAAAVPSATVIMVLDHYAVPALVPLVPVAEARAERLRRRHGERARDRGDAPGDRHRDRRGGHHQLVRPPLLVPARAAVLGQRRRGRTGRPGMVWGPS